MSTPSKSQLAYQWIKERITEATYSPGHRLVLGPIAKQLGVSVVPVREAIRMLESEGLVVFEPNVGAQVALVDETEYRHTMQSLSLVEGYATALAAPEMSTEDVQRARTLNQDLADCLDDFDPHRFTKINGEFHAVLYERCPNPHLLDLVHRCWSRLNVLRDSTFSFVPGRARESVREHEEIILLIESGADGVDLELAARGHRLATLEAFLHRRDDQTAEKEGKR